MLEEQLEELLRQHLATTGASRLQITRDPDDLEEHQSAAKLGTRVSLVASFAQPEKSDQPPTRRERLERAARDLRSCLRDYQANAEENAEWPELAFPDADVAATDNQRLILARIQQFLKALVDSSPLHQEVLMLRGQLIASAEPLDEMEEAQLDLINRQLDRAAVSASGTTHGELVRPGLYARSFWYGAALIGFCEGEYAVDFVRHRNKMVARELSHLLEMLDSGPDEPVKVAPT